MNLTLTKHKKNTVIKENRELNSRKVWTYLLTFFVLAIAGEMIYFSWYFVHTSHILDADPTPTLETNAAKIKVMEKNLDTVEATVRARTGTPAGPESSQNKASVIQ